MLTGMSWGFNLCLRAMAASPGSLGSCGKAVPTYTKSTLASAMAKALCDTTRYLHVGRTGCAVTMLHYQMWYVHIGKTGVWRSLPSPTLLPETSVQ